VNEQCSADVINYPYQTQEVRDLAWACFSPPLLHIGKLAMPDQMIGACALRLTDRRRQWLTQLDGDPTPLLEHLAQRPTHRLGLYFEHLWHFFLHEDAATELVAHNVPLHDGSRTLGEFDCLYYCRERRRHVHLELAVKFFLGLSHPVSSASGNPSEWLGPDNRDRLDLKLDQLLQRQILLAEQPAARPLLDDLGIDQLDREIALKGYLFQQTAGTPAPPPAFNHQNTLSHWVRLDALDRFIAAHAYTTFMRLPKMQWLSDAQTNDQEKVMSVATMRATVARYFESEQYPLMIAALDNRQHESARFFVTPTQWPDSCNAK
jgi:hypothetical protein